VLKLVDDAAAGTVNPAPAPHPAYLACIREGALIAIKNGVVARLLSVLSGSERDDLAAEISALMRQGVSPKRAGRMLDELKGRAPKFRLVVGGAA
jgi:hypothetical protein